MSDPDIDRLAPYMDLSDEALALLYNTILFENRHRLDRPFSEWEVDGEHFDVQAIRAVVLSREGLMDRIAPTLNRRQRREYDRFRRRENADGS